jgi:putative Holliday junction resolvase
MRVLALDIGRRRIGLAISDATATLARPLTTITVTPGAAVKQVAAAIQQLASEEDGVAEVVVGLPRALDGSAHEETAYVQQFVAALQRTIALPFVFRDERLTSREAESRLALRERDWRERKKRLDAAAAAIILQEYLDR